MSQKTNKSRIYDNAFTDGNVVEKSTPTIIPREEIGLVECPFSVDEGANLDRTVRVDLWSQPERKASRRHRWFGRW